MCRSRGSSLAESIVAIGVLALIVLFLVGMITSGFSVQSKGEENVVAVTLAQRLLDQWKSRPYSEVAALQGSPASTTETAADKTYTCVVSAVPLPPPAVNPDNEVLELTVRLDWREATVLGQVGTRDQRASHLEISSVLSPGGGL